MQQEFQQQAAAADATAASLQVRLALTYVMYILVPSNACTPCRQP